CFYLLRDPTPMSSCFPSTTLLRSRPGPASDHRDGGPDGRAPGAGSRGVRPRREGARAHRRVSLRVDAHVHTDQSPDSRVPIDVYAALAVEQGLPEIAITDHVDFDHRDPAFHYSTYADRERV